MGGKAVRLLVGFAVFVALVFVANKVLAKVGAKAAN